MSMSLRRPRCPATRWTRPGGTLSQEATARRTAMLAAPSTGGGVIHSCNSWPSQCNFSLAERGWTMTVMRITRRRCEQAAGCPSWSRRRGHGGVEIAARGEGDPRGEQSGAPRRQHPRAEVDHFRAGAAQHADLGGVETTLGTDHQCQRPLRIDVEVSQRSCRTDDAGEDARAGGEAGDGSLEVGHRVHHGDGGAVRQLRRLPGDGLPAAEPLRGTFGVWSCDASASRKWPDCGGPDLGEGGDDVVHLPDQALNHLDVEPGLPGSRPRPDNRAGDPPGLHRDETHAVLVPGVVDDLDQPSGAETEGSGEVPGLVADEDDLVSGDLLTGDEEPGHVANGGVRGGSLAAKERRAG